MRRGSRVAKSLVALSTFEDKSYSMDRGMGIVGVTWKWTINITGFISPVDMNGIINRFQGVYSKEAARIEKKMDKLGFEDIRWGIGVVQIWPDKKGFRLEQGMNWAIPRGASDELIEVMRDYMERVMKAKPNKIALENENA